MLSNPLLFLLKLYLVSRTVVLVRDDEGHLGISIKGGKEHNLPILVSRVTSNCMQARYIAHKMKRWTSVVFSGTSSLVMLLSK